MKKMERIRQEIREKQKEIIRLRKELEGDEE